MAVLVVVQDRVQPNNAFRLRAMSEFASLCPGYNQVEEFGPDEEYEEEEVSYVTLDLGGEIEPTLIASSSNYRLIVRRPADARLLPSS